jgi:uncharacterized membrane protein
LPPDSEVRLDMHGRPYAPLEAPAPFTFSIEEMIRFGWQKTILQWRFLIPLIAVVWLIGDSPAIVDLVMGRTVVSFKSLRQAFLGPVSLSGLFFGQVFPRSRLAWGPLIPRLVVALIGFVLHIGMTRVSITIAAGKKPSVRELWCGTTKTLDFAFASVMAFFITAFGVCLLIVPGIIWGIQFGFCGYFVLDAGARPTESLKRSSTATLGVKGRIFLLALSIVLIQIVGLLCLGVGALVTWWIGKLAFAHLYFQLQKRASSSA